MMEFAPLHVYSGFSLLKSGFPMERLLKKAKKEGLPYLGLTDFQSLSGYPELYHGLQGSPIAPIFGYDTVIEEFALSFFAIDERGYRNLLALCLSDSKGETTLEFLSSHHDGLIAILQVDACPLPFVPYDEAGLEEGLLRLSKIIPEFHLGLPYGESKRPYVDAARRFAASHPYPVVAFPFLRYEKAEDAIILSIVEAIDQDETLTDKKRLGDDYWHTEEELSAFYTQKELQESVNIAASCHFEFIQKRGGLLHFPVPQGETAETYLRKAAYEGLKKKRPEADERYRQRLEYELGVIHQMGYDDYFLIVADYVHFAKTHQIYVGPGRGSGAGSLVSYCLDIVTPDPIEYDLLFERFLNPMRQSMPDIDVDFEDTKRDQVVAYIKDKYGVERVGHIITMQTLGARASLRDIGRVFSYPSHDIDVLAKAINNPMLSLRENYKRNPEFRAIVDSDPYYLEIVGLAAKIEGLPRQSGLHAAGIVINDTPLGSSIPTKQDEFVGSVAGFEMNYLEEQGFLKMDILGLRNLSIIERCLDLIETHRGVHLEYEQLPIDDPEAISLIAQGKTMGLFQLESPGMNRAIAQVQPTSFLDIVAVIALFRPGPMENIPSFARRKAGKEKISYPHPKLERVLSSTYGIIVYQEQIMQIATEFAGMSLGQADLFRRAISKKNTEKLLSLKDEFLSGCKNNGIDQASAVSVFELIERFANYGFNKSHALAYGMIATQMAYLKAHYPVEFYCAVLKGTNVSDPKFPSIISEIKRSGLHFALPSINADALDFHPCKQGIRFPLNAVKGIQSNLCMGIVDERILHGPYRDIFDFALRNVSHGLTQAALVKLIEAGALDEIDPRRATMALASSSALSYAKALSGEDGTASLLALDLPKPEIQPVTENRMRDLLNERDALGLMVSGSMLEGKNAKGEYHRLAELSKARGSLKVIGIVSKVKTIVTKAGTKMAFLTVYDEESEFEFTLFADEYTNAYPYLKSGNAIAFLAKKDGYRGKESYIASQIAPLEDES
ncbi:MAG: DNA polymerase III subunit alpha [Bacilli bacterium]|nr:DNA polymerase III subunit alpha [Bacilli bacterium]